MLRKGAGFFPQGNGGFFSDREDFAFPPKGEGCTCPDGRGGCQPGCWLDPCSTVAAGGFPAPAGAANRAASSKAACCIRHRRRCAAFPPFSLFGCAKKQPGPPQNPQILWGEEGQRNGAESSPEAGTEWSGFRPGDGPCTVQKRKSAKTEHTGDSKRGRAGSHRAVLFIYLPATDGFVLLCGGG